MQNQIVDYFNMRVIQRNLVYVIGIPQRYADEDTLRKTEFFGQFGNIKKIIINRRNEPCKFTDCMKGKCQYDSGESTASAYVTYSNDFEAKWCIQEVDESILDGKMVRCTFGTTKYCSFYLKCIPCQNNDCMYLHEAKPQGDILTKDELINTRHRLHDFPSKNKGLERVGKKKRFDFLDDIIQLKTQVNFKPPQKILFEPKDFDEL
ncbi:hypothetical protein GINT2_002229 [Glugoides intestinalis]